MSIEKLVEQDFQALEFSFSKGEPLSDVALPRILENISKLDDADRIYHWHEELRRIGGLPSSAELTGVSVEPIVTPADLPVVSAEAEVKAEPAPAAHEITGGDGSLSK